MTDPSCTVHADPPEISVLLPVRNAGRTIGTALRSLADQRGATFEVVAVDDGSTDDTPAHLAAWSARDPRFRVLTTPPRGVVPALNAAAAASRGRFLARMDADDRVEPARLATQRRWLADHPAAVACGTGVRYFPRRHVRAGARRYEAWINGIRSGEDCEREIFVECPLAHPALMMRRCAFESVGGYADVPWPEDYDLVLRWWAAGWRLGNVADVLLHWRESPTRLSRTDTRYGPDAFRRCKAHYLRHRLDRRPVIVWGAGPIGKRFARALAGEDIPVTAFVDVDPRKIGRRVGAAPIIAPDALTAHRGSVYLVAAVGSEGARSQILAAAGRLGFAGPGEACAVA